MIRFGDTTTLKRDPIWKFCVGSGTRSPHHLCPCCGMPWPTGEEIPEHEHLDIIKMIDRGDFG